MGLSRDMVAGPVSPQISDPSAHVVERFNITGTVFCWILILCEENVRQASLPPHKGRDKSLRFGEQIQLTEDVAWVNCLEAKLTMD